MSDLWTELDEKARPGVAEKLQDLGWRLVQSGKHQWRATKDEDGWVEFQTMSPATLLEKVETYEREQRRRRAEWDFG